MNEHEFEPVRGLPETLPKGEHIVWQGEPAWRQLALRVFHLRKVAVYFGLLAGLHVGLKISDGASPIAAAQGALWLVLLGVAAVLILGLLAWLYARTTVYTMTNRRLVMRFGVAMPMMVNIPWDRIDAADLKQDNDRYGNIALTLAAKQRMSYWLLWPHAKPWQFAPVRPMLRCIEDPQGVAEQLRQVVSEQPSASITSIRSAATTDDRLPADGRGSPSAACS